MAEVNIDTIEAHEAGALAEGIGFMYIPFEIRIFNHRYYIRLRTWI